MKNKSHSGKKSVRKKEIKSQKTSRLAIEGQIRKWKKKLLFQSLDQESKDWWEQYEKTNSPSIFLRILKDIDRRNSCPHYFLLSSSQGNQRILIHDSNNVAELKTKLGFNSLKLDVKHWWEQMEKMNQPSLFLALLRELSKRGMTLNDYFMAYVWTESGEYSDVMKTLDRIKLKRRFGFRR